MLQYKGCGLDNVYLANGYERRTTNSGIEVVHIEDRVGLHRTIALTVAMNPLHIDGAEFRFLRKEPWRPPRTPPPVARSKSPTCRRRDDGMITRR